MGGRPCPGPHLPPFVPLKVARAERPESSMVLEGRAGQPFLLGEDPALPLPLWLAAWTIRDPQSSKQRLVPTFILTQRIPLYWVPLSTPQRQRKPRLRALGTWASLLPPSHGTGPLWRVQFPPGSQRGSPGGKVSNAGTLPLPFWPHPVPWVGAGTF